MNKAIVGKKIGMSQIFNEDGRVIPVTVIEAGPCAVVQKKTVERDGYDALQVAFGAVKLKYKKVNGNEKCTNVSNPKMGHYKKAGVEPSRFLREFRFDNCADYSVGQVIKADIFAEGDRVDVSGTSKGKGFSGTIKRWNFHIGPMAHGSGYHRGVGSMGACATPGRVFKNKKMPGQYGNASCTVQNLQIVKVDAERNFLLVKGAVPGARGGMVIIKQTCKR